MSTLILDGRAVREARTPELIERVKQLSRQPTLAIIQVGDLPDSTAFIKAKSAFAVKIGAKVKHIHLPESIFRHELVDEVRECNADADIQGIIVQLPLPIAIDQDAVIEAVDSKKDADGLTSFNVKRWLEGREDAVIPATTRGVKELLEYYKLGLFGKHVVVVGRSMLVGKPLAAFCLNENASVTVCHSKTVDLPEETRKADVLIVAAGKSKLITADHVREGTVVIDVGINTVKGEKLEDEISGRKLVGDVDFEAVKDIASAITPVPGGVGPMTVLALFENLADLCLEPKDDII
ncbi:MAG: tetrahydrofolate dehydrogenase/cyclohydrolase catalytic domain-containing protein [Minisyncoccia bacterium]|jgi:methylenetetrahydrofolate dehydrogenase (NADP+)/methenyltetrahydrofolate cyclohydrolase